MATVCSNAERHSVHELSLCEAILGTTIKHADGRPVTQVTVRIGHLRQVVPDALRFGWELLTEPTDLEGCALVIEQIPATVTLLSGEEFLIVSMDLVEAEA
jgi:hydrogenase nickel incorporation protein HypA/HybF